MNRPNKSIPGETIVIQTGCGKLYLTYNCLNDFEEVFLRLGKSGGCAAAWMQAMGRMISFALRRGQDRMDIIKGLKGVGCPSPITTIDGTTTSCPDAIAKGLEELWINKWDGIEAENT